MPATVFVLSGFLLLSLLAAVIWWRFGSGGLKKAGPVVATTNHKSLPSFRYVSTRRPTSSSTANTNPLAGLFSADAVLTQHEQFLNQQEQQEEEKQAQGEHSESAEDQTEQIQNRVPEPVAPPLVDADPQAQAAASFLGVFAQHLLPTTPSPPTASTEEDTNEPLPESIYDNPLHTHAPTQNDETNRRTAVAMRQRKRAVLSNAGGESKAAMVALLGEK